MSIAGRVEDPELIEAEDITYEQGGATISGYLAHPKGAGTRPGIVVVHEVFGITDHIRDVARRLAAAGYTALAPEMYSRVGRPDPSDRAALFAGMFALPDADVVADAQAAAQLLRGRDDATGTVGIVGFCFGGRAALLAACSTTAFDAAVDCWGGFIRQATPDAETTEARPRPVIDLVDELHGRLYAVVGADDVNPSPADGAEIQRRLDAAGKDGQVEVYEGAGHAFFNDTRPDFYREQPAHRLWDRMLTFFADSLSP